jgi:hypothetical protein
MRVRPLHFTKADLDAAPADHRVAFLGLGQIADEAAILLRLAMAGINSHGNQPETDAANAAAMLATRMLAGRLAEAHDFVGSREVAIAFREIREATVAQAPRLAQAMDEATAGRADLFRAIDGPGPIRTLRNRSSFHVDPALITESFALLPADVDLVDHLGQHRGNSIYGAAETLHLMALSHILDEPDFSRALERTVGEIGTAVGYLSDFVDGFMLGFTLLYFGDKVIGDWIDVPAVAMDDLRFPLFIEAAAE